MEQLMVCIPLIRLYRLHSGVTVLILFENAYIFASSSILNNAFRRMHGFGGSILALNFIP
jgi:hypothetical protein